MCQLIIIKKKKKSINFKHGSSFEIMIELLNTGLNTAKGSFWWLTPIPRFIEREIEHLKIKDLRDSAKLPTSTEGGDFT
jgi:hypothetical protein